MVIGGSSACSPSPHQIMLLLWCLCSYLLWKVLYRPIRLDLVVFLDVEDVIVEIFPFWFIY